MRAGAPAEVFQGVWSLAGSVLAPADHAALATRLDLSLTRAFNRSIRSASGRQAGPKRGARMVSPSSTDRSIRTLPRTPKGTPMYTSRTTSNRSLRRRLGIAASTAALADRASSAASPAGAAAGDLDTQFSGDGMQTGITGTHERHRQLPADSTASSSWPATASYDDGTVQKSGTYVARYDTAGTPDPGFGSGGTKKLNAITGFETVRDIAAAGHRQPARRLRHRDLPRRLGHLHRQDQLQGRSARCRPSVAATASSR